MNRKAEDIFVRALELAPEERGSFLDAECGDDAALRVEVEEWLSDAARADTFFAELTKGAEGVPSPSGQPGEWVGPYKLLQKIGEGGFGVVWMAEQESPIRRRVAVKVIKAGMDTEEVLSRFAAERQALARMEHPNIARVLDAGATATGRPYFAMELVAGVPITRFCDEHLLGGDERLRLFMDVCAAINHAHQKGLIHRDIKPSNVLVTLDGDKPVVKVIDFGVAKATEGRLTEHTFHTRFEQLVGTPAYMSPEQADSSCLDVDTRSDIYSLGVLLYELLTGQTPFDSNKLLESGMVEMCRTLRETEPPPPSTLLTSLGNTRLAAMAARHHAEPLQLISSLRGDLDWIVMKAMEKDRGRRYETVNGLALDLQRYLDHEPVLARPPSRIYRLQKLVRRNRVAFAAGTAVVAALIIGLGTSTWLFVREREARREQVRLRLEGENRQKLTQAMLLLTRDQFAAADQLIHEIPAVEAGLEYAALYRTLGDWHVDHERWQEACTRYAVLFQIGALTKREVTTNSLDYLRYGEALVEAGDLVGYDRFRRSAIDCYANSPDVVWAERIIKVSLLTPTDGDLIRSLDPLVRLTAESLMQSEPPANPGAAAFQAFSLALMSYRDGDSSAALTMCDRSEKLSASDRELAAARNLVRAMAQARLGRIEQARAELDRNHAAVEGFHHNRTPYEFWWDGVLAKILWREAAAMAKE